MTANERERHDPAAEATTVLPETAAQLVELERLQQALGRVRGARQGPLGAVPVVAVSLSRDDN